MKQKTVKFEDRDISRKKVYKTPELTRYGTVKKLTTGGSGTIDEVGPDVDPTHRS